MLRRFKQVVSALTARVTDSDRAFLKRHLTKEQQQLFYRMSIADQRHALNVAYTALKLAPDGIDRELLIKSSLLHDVGKRRGDVSTIDKIITVMADKIAPRWSRRWGRLGHGSKIDNLRHGFYIYYYHAARGARLLDRIGTADEVIRIVRKHHEAPAEDDPPELKILRIADDLN